MSSSDPWSCGSRRRRSERGTLHRRPEDQLPSATHPLVCALLGVSLAWFYKWLARAQGPGAVSGLHTPPDRRRDRAVAVALKKARGLHGSPRLHADLLDEGWKLSEKTVADSMRRQGLVARRIKRRNGLTKQDKTAPEVSRSAESRLHRDPTQCSLGWGHDRDPHRCRKVVPISCVESDGGLDHPRPSP